MPNAGLGPRRRRSCLPQPPGDHKFTESLHRLLLGLVKGGRVGPRRLAWKLYKLEVPTCNGGWLIGMAVCNVR